MTGRVKRCAGVIAGAVVLTMALLGAESSNAAYEPRQPSDFYGINAPDLVPMAWHSPGAASTHLSGIKAAGVDWVRGDITWAGVEPIAPVAGVHVYGWAFFDNFVGMSARKGLTMYPVLGGMPIWARTIEATTAGCGSRGGATAQSAVQYGAFVKAVVQRYGPGGQFWSANPAVPYHPITRVELGNEPNWAGFWCPGPDPETYARLVAAGADGAHSANSDVEVALGGLVMLRTHEFRNGAVYGMATDEFLTRMTQAVPQLPAKVDTIAIHPYDQDPDVNLALIGWIRRVADTLGYGSSKLFLSEFGWGTQGGVNWVDEETRVANFHAFIGQLSRTDCGVDAIAPFAWVTRETEPNTPSHWFGLARADGSLYPAGQAYSEAVALFRGRASQPAPRTTIHLCGNPAPDQDGDGTPDETDDYPLDPGRDEGSGEVPPPDPNAPEDRMRAPRVPADFFGTFAREMPWEASKRKAYYDSMAAIHLGVVRDTVIWSNSEPLSPSDPAHVLAWDGPDARTLGLAKRGITVQPTMIRPPAWVPGDASADSALAGFLSAYARRYGTGGTFWTENTHLDPSLAVKRYEIWSDADLDGAAWDGSASPGEYADTYLAGRAAVRDVDSSAQAVVPVHDTNRFGTAASFIRAMTATRPQVAGKIDGVYVEVLNSSSTSEIHDTVAALRLALDETQNSTAQIEVGIGWNTNGPGAISESERTDRMTGAASQLARSNCGISGVFADAWTMTESNPANPWHWLGIADRTTGALRPSGEAFGSQSRRFLGYEAQEAPRGAVLACGSTPPDRDGDGAADANDDFPIDPERSDGTGPSLSAERVGRRTNPATFAIRGKDPAGVVSTKCRVDAGKSRSCGRRFRTSRLRRGRHTFVVTAVNGFGNRSQARVKWRVRRR